jgi:hypothetical protein
MDRKLFIIIVVAALGGIAYFVKTKRIGGGRTRRASTSTTEAPAQTASPNPTADPAKQQCESDCIRAWTKNSAQCAMDEVCSRKVDGTKDRCMSSCR